MEENDKLQETAKTTKREKNKYFKIGLTIFLTTAACILFFFAIFRLDTIIELCGKITKAAEPIIIGLILAYLLMPVKNFIEIPLEKFLLKKGISEKKSKKTARSIGIFGSIVFLIIVIAVLIAIFVPALVSSVLGLIDAMPKYVESFLKWIQDSQVGDSSFAYYFGEAVTKVTDAFEEWANNKLLPEAQRYISQITSGVVSVFKTVLNSIIGVIVMVYVMSIEESLVGQSKKIIYAIFSPKKGNRIIEIIRKSNEIFGGFIIGKILDSAIIGVICYIGCLILQMPSALLVSVIIGVTNVIPFFGPFIGAIPSILIVLIQSPWHGLYLAIFILILQQVDGNIIGPKILGDTTGLSSFWVLFAILVAGGLFGFFGMLLGVPVFAVIYYVLQQFLRYRMERKKLAIETSAYVKLQYIDEVNKTMVYEKPKEKSKEENK